LIISQHLTFCVDIIRESNILFLVKDKSNTSIADYLGIIVKWRVFLVRNVLITTLIAIVISFILPHRFTAKATILPPSSQQQGLLGMLSGGMAAGLSAAALAQGGLPGMVTPSDLYAAIMNSACIQGKIIRDFDLQREFRTKTMDDTYKALDKIVRISVSPEGIISVSVTYKNKLLAADIANAFVKELDRFNTETAMTVGKKYRIFIEQRLKETEDSLRIAEESLKTFQEQNRTVSLDAEIQAAIETIAQLKSQIIMYEVQKGAWSSAGQTDNPYLYNINRELSALRSQLSKIEIGGSTEDKTGFGAGFAVPLMKLPEIALEYARLYRDVKVQVAVYELLAQQYEQAKIMELKDTPTVQFLDQASPPEKRSFPRRRLIAILAFVFSGIFSVIFIFTAEYVNKIKQNKDLYGKWQYITGELERDLTSIKSKIKKWRRKP
jgi:tyrosine-protein kinase Etk/Wzc